MMGRPSPQLKQRKRQKQKCKRKLIFSKKHQESTNNNYKNDETETDSLSREEDVHMSVPQSSIGDVDVDVMEMSLYDDYRQIDGELYSNAYLYKCRQKLMMKTREYKARVHELEKEVTCVKLASKEENERIREVIAFGKSRSGKVVQSAMGTSRAAGKIIKELEKMCSVDSSDY